MDLGDTQVRERIQEAVEEVHLQADFAARSEIDVDVSREDSFVDADASADVDE